MAIDRIGGPEQLREINGASLRPAAAPNPPPEQSSEQEAKAVSSKTRDDAVVFNDSTSINDAPTRRDVSSAKAEGRLRSEQQESKTALSVVRDELRATSALSQALQAGDGAAEAAARGALTELYARRDNLAKALQESGDRRLQEGSQFVRTSQSEVAVVKPERVTLQTAPSGQPATAEEAATRVAALQDERAQLVAQRVDLRDSARALRSGSTEGADGPRRADGGGEESGTIRDIQTADAFADRLRTDLSKLNTDTLVQNVHANLIPSVVHSLLGLG